MKTFLEWTKMDMNKFNAYSIPHIAIVIVIFLVIFIVLKLTKHLSDKNSRRFLFSIGLLLLVFEVYKHLFYTFVLNDGIYPWWIFPFQLCSVPIYLLLLLPWVKNRRMEESIYAFLASYNLLGGFLSLFEPSGLIHTTINITAHAFAWHGILVMIGFYLINTKRAFMTSDSFRLATKLFLLLTLMAFVINLALWNIGSQSVNMFFVGPLDNPLIVFKDIAKHFGWWVATILYVPSVIIGAKLIGWTAQWIQNRRLVSLSQPKIT